MKPPNWNHCAAAGFAPRAGIVAARYCARELICASLSGPLLQVTNLQKSFAGFRAVNGVSFDVGAGEIVALIGPNGAGKTTLFNMITGQTTSDNGLQSVLVLAGREAQGVSSTT